MRVNCAAESRKHWKMILAVEDDCKDIRGNPMHFIQLSFQL